MTAIQPRLMDGGQEPARILVIDDEPSVRETCKGVLEELGHNVETAETVREGIDAFHNGTFDVVITDLKLPDGDGVQIVQDVTSSNDEVVMLVMTGYATVESALAALEAGAADYFPKPVNFAHMDLVISRLLEQKRIRHEHREMLIRADRRSAFGELVGASAVMRDMYRQLEAVAETDTTVLITGESGTGKELAARAIHKYSARGDNRFVSINCAATPEFILESELFGHERGAYTGAVTRKFGLLEHADGGTVLFDEIGDTTKSFQTKVLRFLQEREFLRVGGNEPVSVDVRVIAATNAELKRAIDLGEFREDLYYRLHVVPIVMPPLRVRKDDIPLLAEHFLLRSSPEGTSRRLGPDVSAALLSYDWPGNVREFENVIARMVAMHPNEQVLTQEHLPPELRRFNLGAGPAITSAPLAEARANFERDYLMASLEKCDGNVSKAARLAGINRTTLHKMMNRLDIDSADFRQKNG
jgi:DNA-binding NtrC family response regulator